MGEFYKGLKQLGIHLKGQTKAGSSQHSLSQIQDFLYGVVPILVCAQVFR